MWEEQKKSKDIFILLQQQATLLVNWPDRFLFIHTQTLNETSQPSLFLFEETASGLGENCDKIVRAIHKLNNGPQSVIFVNKSGI